MEALKNQSSDEFIKKEPADRSIVSSKINTSDISINVTTPRARKIPIPPILDDSIFPVSKPEVISEISTALAYNANQNVTPTTPHTQPIRNVQTPVSVRSRSQSRAVRQPNPINQPTYLLNTNESIANQPRPIYINVSPNFINQNIQMDPLIYPRSVDANMIQSDMNNPGFEKMIYQNNMNRPILSSDQVLIRAPQRLMYPISFTPNQVSFQQGSFVHPHPLLTSVFRSMSPQEAKLQQGNQPTLQQISMAHQINFSNMKSRISAVRGQRCITNQSFEGGMMRIPAPQQQIQQPQFPQNMGIPSHFDPSNIINNSQLNNGIVSGRFVPNNFSFHPMAVNPNEMNMGDPNLRQILPNGQYIINNQAIPASQLNYMVALQQQQQQQQAIIMQTQLLRGQNMMLNNAERFNCSQINWKNSNLPNGMMSYTNNMGALAVSGFPQNPNLIMPHTGMQTPTNNPNQPNQFLGNLITCTGQMIPRPNIPSYTIQDQNQPFPPSNNAYRNSG
ncbi:hypothetical protein MXB_1769 [Myxobolus squamalis]|nr:hypothetical protein MXB_1769 [Myxobolus squamalis]